MITAKQLFDKSQEQIVTHRKTWEQLDTTHKFQYEAYAQWANELFQQQTATEKQKDMSFEKLADELAVEKGYLIKEYPAKWKQAKDIAIRMDKSEYAEESAFSLACRLFLELGGKRNLNTPAF